MIKKLLTFLTNRDKKIIFTLIIFSIVISIVEMIGISAIMPFISVATDFSIIHNNTYYIFIYNIFNFTNDIYFVSTFGVVLLFYYIFRSFINAYYFYILNKFIHSRYHIIASKLFDNYIGMSYMKYTRKNKSNLTKTIITEATHLTILIYAILFMISEVFVAILIYGIIIYIDYKITIFLTIILGLNAFLMIRTISVRIKDAGLVRAETQKNFYELINKSFGNFKLIKLHLIDKNILKEFENTTLKYAKANMIYDTLGHVPRLFLEAVGFSIIVLLIIYLIWNNQGNISNALGVISIFVLALYRLLPSANRIMSSYNQIIYYSKSLDIVYSDLKTFNEELGEKQVEFNNQISLKNIKFSYEKNCLIFDNITLNINKGSKVAFVGESGSGKSSLIDIIIGINKVNSGSLESDNIKITNLNVKQWRKKIGYIPQSVYLFEGTVGENIVFGSTYNSEKIDEVLKKARIYDFFNTKNGQETIVGESGILLSGGQKQRIAIARALYKNPEILVLDEATSSLDEAIEKQIMDEIYEISKNMTLIIIAHRLSTIQKCDIIYTLSHGKIVNIEEKLDEK